MICRKINIENTISPINIFRNYVKPRHGNDIAIIKVESPFQINNYVSPVCLPSREFQVNKGSGIVIGMGKSPREEHGSLNLG